MATPEFELPHIPPSEEVCAYPFVLQLVAVNFVALIEDCTESDRKVGLVLAINYCREIMEDVSVCNDIAAASGM